MLTGLNSSGSVYCVAYAGQKTAEILQFRPNFHNLGRGYYAHALYWARPNLATDSTLTSQISFESIYCHLPGSKNHNFDQIL